jgi:hypothetical protein
MRNMPGWLKSLLGLLGLLAVLYTLTLIPWGNRKKSPAGVPSDPAKIRVEAPQASLTLEKSGAFWRLTEPVQGPADEDAVRELTEALKDLQLHETVTSRPDSHGQYELDARAAKVQLWAAGAKDPWTMAVGKTAGRTDWSYVRLGEKPEVRLASGLRREAVDRRLAGWRQRRLILVPAGEDIHRVSVVRGKTRFVLEKSSDAWTVNGKPADGVRAAEFVSALRTLEAEDLSDPSSPAEAAKTHGFTAASTAFDVSISSAAPVAFTVGKKDSQGRFPLHKEGDPVVYLIAEYRWSPLEKEAKDFLPSK